MTSEDGRQRERLFVCGEVERRTRLSREEFKLEFERRKPVLLAGGAKRSAAARLWDPEYLIGRAGHARLELLDGIYDSGARERGLPDVREVETTLAELVTGLLRGEQDKGYLFNTESGILVSNQTNAEFRAGWGKDPNPGLSALAQDFELPGFLREEDFIHAWIVLGGPDHSAPLHYDLVGAKTLVQVRGRKRFLLFPPSEAGFFHLQSWFEEPASKFHGPHVAAVDLHNPDFERFPDLRHARGFEALVEPGDVLYWPDFWAHDVRNLDPFTLAVSVTLEEMYPTPMHFRDQLGLMCRLFLRLSRDPRRGFDLSSEAGLLRGLRELERTLLSEEFRSRRTFWSWHNSIWNGW